LLNYADIKYVEIDSAFFTKEGINMDINSVSNSIYSTDAYKTNAKSAEKHDDAKKNDVGVVYEKSANKIDASLLIKQSKDQIDGRFSEMVRNMISEQRGAIDKYNQTITDILNGKKSLKEAAEEAAKELSEDGYWGVKQTSDRIFSFAKALTGGDSSKMPAMLDAFKKGYEQATGTWGKDLPNISKKTYEAVEDKFNQWKNGTYKPENNNSSAGSGFSIPAGTNLTYMENISTVSSSTRIET